MRDRTILRNRKTTTEQDSANVLAGFLKLEEVYAVQEVARLELEQATGKPICVSGCGKCCEGMTPVASRLEALYTLANMSFLPSYTDLKQRAARWMTDGTPGQDYGDLSKMPCPFLGDDKDCTIYEMRPLQCRGYGVTNFAMPACPRPLHYTESDDNRMYIDEHTSLGQVIKRKTQYVINWIRDKNPVMSQVGFFPALIAQEMIEKDKLVSMPIADGKMALRPARVQKDRK